MSSAQFVYVVLCHRGPEQVLALVRRLRSLSPAAGVVVRHDRGAAFLSGSDLRKAGGEASVLLDDEAHPVVWGDWSMVEATERAVALARSVFDPDWVVLVSGQDWPVRDLASWERDLAASTFDAVMRADPVDLAWSTGLRITETDMTRARWTHDWRTLPAAPWLRVVPARLRSKINGRFSGSLMWYLRPVVLRQLPRGLGWKLGVRRRDLDLPFGWRVFKGEQWLALNRSALGAVDRVTERTPSVRRFFAGTHIPDESYLQTVVGNTPDLRVQEASISWHRFDGPSPSPGVLDAGDVGLALGSGAPFARKVDDVLSPGVISLFDATVDIAVAIGARSEGRP